MAIKKLKNKERILETARPDLAKQWHPIKNKIFSPSNVTCGSHMKAWWQHYDVATNKWHEWTSTIANRFYGNGCAICSGHQIQIGVNDLASVRPDIASEWHSTKNGDLLPTMVSVGKSRKVWWQHYHEETNKWHEWKSTINDRTGQKNSKCSVCDGKQIQIGINDLWTTSPSLARQWHPTKNGKITPLMVTRNCGKDFWWRHYDRKTKKWHEWHDTVDHRENGRNCAVCHGKQVQIGVNDLASRFPKIAKEWHPTKNGTLTPKRITYGSNQEVWWRHYHKQSRTWHEWEDVIAHRTNQALICNKCSSKGFSTTTSAYLYLIAGKVKKSNNRKTRIIQFGISKSINARLSKHARSGFNLEPVLLKSFDRAIDALNIETSLKRLMREYEIPTATQRGIKFDGSTEAFLMEDAMDNEDFLEEFKSLVGLE